MTDQAEKDLSEIRSLISRQFESIGWAPDRPSDRDAFVDDFLPGAMLFPASRPVAPKSVEAFVERMKGVAASGLDSLQETVLGTEIRVFGNVAVATAVCGISENDGQPSRGVEALLLIEDRGRWRIAAQAWDMESQQAPIREDLLNR